MIITCSFAAEATWNFSVLQPIAEGLPVEAAETLSV